MRRVRRRGGASSLPASPPYANVVDGMTRPTLTPEQLLGLVQKYEEIERLRVAHLAPDEPDPRRAMAALAARFPGALREIDELPLDDVRAKLAALQLALRDGGGQAPWMVASALFHATARGALAAKRWLAGRKHVDDGLRASFARAADRLRYAEDAGAWADDLARVATPPRGRVMDLVFERVALKLGVDDAEARRLVFGDTPRMRRARSASALTRAE